MKKLFIGLVAIFLLFSCGDDSTAPPDEQEDTAVFWYFRTTSKSDSFSGKLYIGNSTYDLSDGYMSEVLVKYSYKTARLVMDAKDAHEADIKLEYGIYWEGKYYIKDDIDWVGYQNIHVDTTLTAKH